MRYLFHCLLASTLAMQSALSADVSFLDEENVSPQNTLIRQEAFTGRVTRDRVRVRLHPNLESPIFRELNRNDLIVVVGQQDDFYAIKAPSDMKAYIYRTFVLDGIVEGNHVNVRIEPHTEAPVIAQLSTGVPVEGRISERNTKWLEIDPPATTLLYVSADFIEKVGDAQYLTKYEARQEEVNHILNTTLVLSTAELQKPFAQMDREKIVNNYHQIIDEYPEFQQQAQKAKEQLAKFEEAYLYKKVEYLESKVSGERYGILPPEEEVFTHHSTPAQPTIHQPAGWDMPAQSTERSSWGAKDFGGKQSLWVPVEATHYEKWAVNNGGRSVQDFYEEERSRAVALHGVLQGYDRPVRNKPGDYILVNSMNGQPIAYLYSTQIDLRAYVGEEVHLEAIQRPNNHFAYPAYFVISAE